MKLIVIVKIIFFMFSSSAEVPKCQFRSDLKKIYSLSGPFTVALDEMGLLGDKKMAGISLFHPISKNQFEGDILPGGIFLSHETGLKLRGAKVIFDKSIELKKMLSHLQVDLHEIDSYGLMPNEVTLKLSTLLKDLTINCGNEIASYEAKTQKLLNQIKQNVPKSFNAIFFLGEITPEKFPEILMVQDGVLRWLIHEKLLVSYPSNLAYLPWSSRILNSLSPKTLLIGVKDSGGKMTKRLDLTLQKNKMNLIYPGALIPGVSQLEAWLFLLKNLKS